MISSLCAEKWYCRANNSYFAEKLWINKTNISRYVSSLQEKWYISCDVSQDQGNKRHISIAENNKGYCQKQQEGIAENSKTPIAENSKHNNTIKNNTNTILEVVVSWCIEWWNKQEELPACRWETPDIKKAINKIMKDYDIEQIKYWFKRYVKDIEWRNETMAHYNHRFSFYEFVKQENWLRKFINM